MSLKPFRLSIVSCTCLSIKGQKQCACNLKQELIKKTSRKWGSACRWASKGIKSYIPCKQQNWEGPKNKGCVFKTNKVHVYLTSSQNIQTEYCGELWLFQWFGCALLNRTVKTWQYLRNLIIIWVQWEITALKTNSYLLYYTISIILLWCHCHRMEVSMMATSNRNGVDSYANSRL